MNQNKLKSYAQQARRDFIAAVSDRALLYGLTPGGIEPAVEQGDVVLIGDRAFSRDVAANRKRLEERVLRDGFEHTMEAMAYTWFNRFAAIRYMELHGYLDHGYRVLSHPEGGQQPEILEHAAAIDLPGLDRDRAVELKLDGTKDEELYRLLLQAQCNALHRAMPFLFESIGGETELLLPANLLHTDSLIERLVEGVDEADWDEIEIVGWLYQFYISEKKDEVIGKVVKPEDIPAATQLFTPNWIVKYLAQNSLGAQWLATYPDSSLKQQMEYYIEPAEQTKEVKAQLEAVTPDSLTPEELTLIDPACGSGHILVEAYDLFKAIYLERGYRKRDVPKLILEKNLFGLDIDERAAQLTGFALMMTGRADDRRLFEREVNLNVMAMVNSTDFDADRLAERVKLADHELRASELDAPKRLFEHATTFGSLIQVPEDLAATIPALRKLSETSSQDLFVSDALKTLGALVRQAEILAAQYNAVVANPPYVGGKRMNSQLREYLRIAYTDVKSDVFTAFTVRCSQMGLPTAHVGIMNPNVWMYISSHEDLRSLILETRTLTNLIELPRSGFKGASVQICAYTFTNVHMPRVKGCYIRLVELEGGDVEMAIGTKHAASDRQCDCFFEVCQDEFKKIPGSPLAYWVSRKTKQVFEIGTRLGTIANVTVGLQTGDNNKFVRRWYEVEQRSVNYRAFSREEARHSCAKWFPYNKGGEFRKWFGNNEYLVNWEDDGREIRVFGTENGGRPRSRPQNTEYYFRPSITWSFVGSDYFGVRYSDAGAVFDVGGSSAFPSEDDHLWVTGFLCSKQVLGIHENNEPDVEFPSWQCGISTGVPRRIASQEAGHREGRGDAR